MTFFGGYMQMTFFSRLPSGTFIIPKILLLIYFSNQACLEHAKEISYNSQRDISNGVWHAPIKAYLAPFLKGFVVGSEIFNLTIDLSFDYNSCISSLNDWCKGILGSYIFKYFQWYFGAQIGVCLPFQLKLWIYSHMNA